MLLRELNIFNYRNIAEANLLFADKINCFVGDNGMGKTNLLDAVYLLSFTKSGLTTQDSQCILHGEQMAMVKGCYDFGETEPTIISCAIRAGKKKQFRRGQTDYKRLLEHIGLIPLVMVSPADQELIIEGSEERRRFLDGIISQYNRQYLEHLSQYQALLKQRNAVLKQAADRQFDASEEALLDILEDKMSEHDLFIYEGRRSFIERFRPYFDDIYSFICQNKERTHIGYISQVADRDIRKSLHDTRERDHILGWTTQGIHKDDLDMQLDTYPIREVGSQGQQKTFLIALKLSQACFLAENPVSVFAVRKQKPLLLLDDIFDKLDSQRVERIITLVGLDRFGQTFLSDTDRQHISSLINNATDRGKVFIVDNGIVKEN